MSRVTVSVVTPSFSVSTAVPDQLAGLAGDRHVDVAVLGAGPGLRLHDVGLGADELLREAGHPVGRLGVLDADLHRVALDAVDRDRVLGRALVDADLARGTPGPPASRRRRPAVPRRSARARSGSPSQRSPSSQAAPTACSISSALADVVGHQLLELAAEERHLDGDLEVGDVTGRVAVRRRGSPCRPPWSACPARGSRWCPSVGEVQTSVTTARVVSPAIFFAIAGQSRGVLHLVDHDPAAGAVGPSGVTVTVDDTTPCAAPTFSRQAGSVSMAKTSAAGASYVVVCWNLMAAHPDAKCCGCARDATGDTVALCQRRRTTPTVTRSSTRPPRWPATARAPRRRRATSCVPLLAAYYRHVSTEELDDRSDVDVYGAYASHHHLAAERQAGTTKVRVYTPTVAEHGWSAGGHSVVEVVTDDMSFLVDSLTMELARQHRNAHLVLHPTLDVERDDAGQLVALHPVSTGSATPHVGTRARVVDARRDRPADRRRRRGRAARRRRTTCAR